MYRNTLTLVDGSEFEFTTRESPKTKHTRDVFIIDAGDELSAVVKRGTSFSSMSSVPVDDAP